MGEDIVLKNGDCLELMKELPDKSIDLFICDLPYGETNCSWDSIIDMEEFWKQFKRVRKSKKVACIHFCSTKFGYTLIKSWEKGFKMDMVWKKRNKTGGLQSRHRPMRNHEMVYFFYEQAPKYNRDKYHKRIEANKKDHSIEKEEGEMTYGNTGVMKDTFHKTFEPPNPASVLVEGQKKAKDWGYKKCSKSFDNNEELNGGRRIGANYDPPNPASVVEETPLDPWGCKNGGDKGRVGYGLKFDPPNPASVVDEDEKEKEMDEFGWSLGNLPKENRGNEGFEPVLPTSMFESTKVFIGKRHHQTEKPLDILEFFLKYWSDENDTILDPTMGSGSTGVACKNMKRKFIGYEKDEKIFEIAKARIKK